MKRLGVIGWPVGHSRSPAIQNAALAAAGLGEDWTYQLLPIPPELFDETVPALAADGFRGVNVTTPHKERALALALASDGRASARSQAIGAANTLLFNADGTIEADNTDAPALIDALALRGGVSGASVVVLGAGGSARSAVWALQDAGAGDLRVWNRTPQRARELCAKLGGAAVSEPAELAGAEILVNCTSVGLADGDTIASLPVASALSADCRVVVDFVYRQGGTPLILAAASAGIPVIDGLELLVGQGALAFKLFTGQPAPLDAMRRAVGLGAE